MTVPETLSTLKEISPKLKFRNEIGAIYRAVNIEYKDGDYIIDIV